MDAREDAPTTAVRPLRSHPVIRSEPVGRAQCAAKAGSPPSVSDCTASSPRPRTRRRDRAPPLGRVSTETADVVRPSPHHAVRLDVFVRSDTVSLAPGKSIFIPASPRSHSDPLCWPSTRVRACTSRRLFEWTAVGRRCRVARPYWRSPSREAERRAPWATAPPPSGPSALARSDTEAPESIRTRPEPPRAGVRIGPCLTARVRLEEAARLAPSRRLRDALGSPRRGATVQPRPRGELDHAVHRDRQGGAFT